MPEKTDDRLEEASDALAEALAPYGSEACMGHLADILRMLEAQGRKDFDPALRYLRDMIESRLRSGQW